MDFFIKLIALYYPRFENYERNEELSYYIMKELDMIRENDLYKIHLPIHQNKTISSSYSSVNELLETLNKILEALKNTSAFRAPFVLKEYYLSEFFINANRKGFIDEIEAIAKLRSSLVELLPLREQSIEYCLNNSVLTNDVSANVVSTLRSLNNVLWELYELLVTIRELVERN